MYEESEFSNKSNDDQITEDDPREDDNVNPRSHSIMKTYNRRCVYLKEFNSRSNKFHSLVFVEKFLRGIVGCIYDEYGASCI